MSARLFAMVLVFFVGSAVGFEPRDFDNPQQAQDYDVLVEELRCPVCQGQNIADSNAPQAQDMRNAVYRELKKGKSRDQIRQFMIQRFGDTITYRPPLQGNTLLLWLTPGVVLLIGAFVLWRIIRNRRPTSDTTP